MHRFQGSRDYAVPIEKNKLRDFFYDGLTVRIIKLEPYSSVRKSSVWHPYH